MTEVPLHILDVLGPAPEDVSGAGACRVLRGEGRVAKMGPVAVIEAEAALLEIGASLPLRVPQLFDRGPGWLLIEDIGDTKETWSDADLAGALTDLAALHDMFVDSEMLSHVWLRHPFGPDLDGLLALGREDARILPRPLRSLLEDPSPLLTILAQEPNTVLHGDPWPANVRRPDPDQRVWLDWEQASVGPAAADVATWLDQTPWHVGHAIDDEWHLRRYLSARTTPVDETRFRAAVDAASLLWFFAFDLPNLGDADSRLAQRMVRQRMEATARLELS
jgi:hypothetical protein